MSERYRESQFIDFNAGRVLLDPEAFVCRVREPWSVNQKIDFFQCRVDVWQLGVAVGMLKQIEAAKGDSLWCQGAYGLLSVITSYFEMVGKVLNPKSAKSGTSSVDFNIGFGNVYSHLKPALEETDISMFRDLLRNGMYHLGYPKKNLLISMKTAGDIEVIPVRETIDDQLYVGIAYLVNPHRMTHTLVGHFDEFITRLRSSDGLRKKFVEYFDDLHAAW